MQHYDWHSSEDLHGLLTFDDAAEQLLGALRVVFTSCSKKADDAPSGNIGISMGLRWGGGSTSCMSGDFDLASCEGRVTIAVGRVCKAHPWTAHPALVTYNCRTAEASKVLEGQHFPDGAKKVKIRPPRDSGGGGGMPAASLRLAGRTDSTEHSRQIQAGAVAHC
jgi:hypothetical protein